MSLALIQGQLHRIEPVYDPSLRMHLDIGLDRVRAMCAGEPIVAGVGYYCMDRGSFERFTMLPNGEFDFEGHGTAIVRAVLGHQHIDAEVTA